jgi:hypothetical protein
MESLNWQFVNFIFNTFSFIVGIVAFCIIKFNDFKHLELRMTKHEDSHTLIETKQIERHEGLLKSINELTREVAFLSGKNESK